MLPADLVTKLNQCAANDLAGPRDHWFNWLAGFTITVFVGLVLEFPELRYELKLIAREWIPYFKYRIHTPPDRRLHAAKVAAFVGWLLIVVGVGGERYSEVRVKDLDASIQGCSDAKVREATLEAGDAKDSAESAKASAKVIGEQAAILEAATKRLIWQGPRDILLIDAGQSFDSLRKFPRQKFRFSVCRPDLNLTFGNIALTEIGRTEQAIFSLLKDRGWRMIVPQGISPKTPYPFIADFCASEGVSVDASDNAMGRTRDAAKGLQSAINTVLSSRVKVGDCKMCLLPPLPPLAPDVIDIHVGLHPAKPAVSSRNTATN